MRGWQTDSGGGVALAAALAACRSGRDATAAGKTLVVGLVAEPTSLDPGQLTDINSMKLLGAIYDTLVRFKPDSFDLGAGPGHLLGHVADGLTYTFKLRQGVKFHDGTDFNADAVKFTYDRLLDPKQSVRRHRAVPVRAGLLRLDRRDDRRRSGDRPVPPEAARTRRWSTPSP